MFVKRAQAAVSLLLSVLPVGCADDFTDSAVDASVESERGLGVEASELRLRRDERGVAASVRRLDHGALFRLEEGADPAAQLLAFARANHELFGLAPFGVDEKLTTLVLDRVIELDGGARIHRFVQRYRGFRVMGPGEVVSLTSLADGSVLSLVGVLVDERETLAGAEPRIDPAAARAIASAAAEGEADEDSELVAVPQRGTLAWAVGVASKHSTRVLVSAADGEVLARQQLHAEDAFDGAYLPQVRANQMTNNPVTSTTALYPGVGSLWDGSYNPFYGFLVRMGDDRAMVLDLEGNNDGPPTTYFAQQYFPTGQPNVFGGLNSRFLATSASDLNQFRTQNLYHKLRSALGVLDARQSSVGWDHHPTTPFGAFDPAPITLLTNADMHPEGMEWDVCDDGAALAVYDDCKVSGSQAPYPSEWTSCVYMCTSSVGPLLHELGHHVDNHATYGIMGDTIASGTCIQGTTDEAIALRETIGDITALYLARKLYTTLPYTLSTAGSPCTFGSIGQGTTQVHDPSCLGAGDSIASFDDGRPGNDFNDPCTPTQGYRIPAVSQAVWAWLNRKFCDESFPFSCVSVLGGNNDEFMNGVIYALTLSNAQSYETFFENIETYIWVSMGAAEADNFRSLMSTYGVLAP